MGTLHKVYFKQMYYAYSRNSKKEVSFSNKKSTHVSKNLINILVKHIRKLKLKIIP